MSQKRRLRFSESKFDKIVFLGTLNSFLGGDSSEKSEKMIIIMVRGDFLFLVLMMLMMLSCTQEI